MRRGNHGVRLDLWVFAEVSSTAIKPFFDPGLPDFLLMQSTGGLTEAGPFLPQAHSQIGQIQAFRSQDNEYPYVKPDPGVLTTAATGRAAAPSALASITTPGFDAVFGTITGACC